MAAPRKYGDELRERATRMSVESRRDPATRSGAIPRVAERLGMHPETLRNWVRQAEIDDGARPGTSSDDSKRLVELERENREQDQVAPEDRVPTAVLVEYIDQHRDRFGVEPICAVLREADVQIAPSTFYAAKTRAPSARSVRDTELITDITVAHRANLGVYGARKIHAALNREGITVARCTVERLMRAEWSAQP